MRNSNRFGDKSWAYIVGMIVGVVTLAFLGIAFQAWLLGLILSWFAIQLTFWQCFAIVFLTNSIFSAAKSSK